MIKLTKEDKLMILALILVFCMVPVFLALEVLEKFRIVSDTEIHTEIPKNQLEDLYNQLSSGTLYKKEEPVIKTVSKLEVVRSAKDMVRLEHKF